jgi:hypothetical protein
LRFPFGSGALGLHGVSIGAGGGGIELDQHIARIDVAAVAHVDAAHNARLQRLDHLGVVVHHQAAGGRGHDVDLGNDAPA